MTSETPEIQGQPTLQMPQDEAEYARDIRDAYLRGRSIGIQKGSARTINTASHLVNGSLFKALGNLEMARLDPDLSPEVLRQLEQVNHGIQGAADALSEIVRYIQAGELTPAEKSPVPIWDLNPKPSTEDKTE